MDIDRLMTHAKKIEAEKLKEQEGETKKARTRHCEYGRHMFGVRNHSQF